MVCIHFAQTVVFISRRNQASLTMLHKIHNKQVNVDHSLLTTTPNNKFLIPHSKTKHHMNLFFPRAIRLWNQLPTEIKDAPTVLVQCHRTLGQELGRVQYFPYNARFSISHKWKKSKVSPKPALGVISKSLFIENTLKWIKNYLLLLNIIENTILISVYTSMTDILTFTATR